MNITTTTKAMKLEGVPQLVKTVKTIAATLNGEGAATFTERLKDIAMKPCNVIADEARDLVPVVTGTLRAGIFAAPLKARAGAAVGVRGVRYADWVEYGTSRATPHPFLRPAVLAVRPLAANMMAGDLGKLISDVAASEAWHAPDKAA
jgi:HK97 gp10 family phage protein